MEKSRLAVVNALPTKTYRFLKVNETGIGIPEQAAAGQDPWDSAALPEGVTLSRLKRQEDLPEEIRTIATGMGASIDRALSEHGIPPYVLTVEEGADIDAPIVLPVSVSCGSASLSSLVIRAKAGSRLTVIADITSDASGCAAARSFYGRSTRLYAERGARISLVHIERMNASITSFDDIGGWCDENAEIDLTTLALTDRSAAKGNEGNFLGTRVTLASDTSRFANRTGYYCGGQTSLDMNYVVEQRGKETASDMIFRGVLTDHAAKTW
ncbi:MAG: SufD family Fe-S cluster assembly protein, partial [Lachnospiraceae bacterium]|nr:SufD family Fe-S cluster assembly protein [Lachnospiraceae bacterium]